MRSLYRVCLGDMLNVFNDDVRRSQLVLQELSFLLDLLDACWVIAEDFGPFHLMKDRVVGRVYFIASVYICSKQPALDSFGEDFDFMGRSVCAKHRVPIDVVGVGLCSAWMVRGEGERVEVLVGSNDGRERGEVRKIGEMVLYESAQRANWMSILCMQTFR